MPAPINYGGGVTILCASKMRTNFPKPICKLLTERIDNSMITLEQVMEQINKTKDRFTSAINRIPQLQDKIFDLSKQWRELVINGADDKELQEVQDKSLQAEKELELLENLDADKEIRQTLAKDKKLADLAQSFIEQEEATLETMVLEDAKFVDAVKDAYTALIATVEELRTHRKKMVEITGQIQDVKQALGMPVPSGGIYDTNYRRSRLNSIPHDKMFNKIRIAAGLHPEY